MHRGNQLQREWFARIRIREDRLARLWVSNLVGHDVVVWSNKERRWVALLAVPGLRRALETAESELPSDPRSAVGRSASIPPSRLRRLPDTLPPAPPLAMLNSAAAGVGELRLRSIAQSQAPGLERAGFAGATRSLSVLLSPLPAKSRRSTNRRPGPNPALTKQSPMDSGRGGHWRRRAVDRVVWMAAGVLAMFVVSGAGSADQKPNPIEGASVLLTADRSDPTGDHFPINGAATSFAESLVGPKPECPVRPNCCQSPTGTPQSASEVAEEPNPESTLNVRQRTTGEGTPRPPTSAPARSAPSETDEPSGVPPDLNFQAIRAALFNAAALARACPGESISGKAVVTFESNGTVRSVDIPLLIGERPDRDCIVRSFKSIRVPRFSGRLVAVKKDF